MRIVLLTALCAVSAYALEITPEMINAAHKKTEESLKVQEAEALSNVVAKEASSCPFSSGVHYRSRRSDRKAVEMAKMAKVFEATTKNLIESVGHDDETMKAIQSAPLKGTALESLQLQCRQEERYTCNPQKRYRESDGSCNNLQNPLWGRSHICMRRLLEPAYIDGVSEPRGGRDYRNLPNARTVSGLIHPDRDVPLPSVTHLVMQVGQFIDHDWALAPMEADPGEIVNLGNPNNVIDCCSAQMRGRSECFSIELFSDDPFYGRHRQDCMNLPRTAPCPYCTMGRREQQDILTSYLDASQIYGSTNEDTIRLRLLQGGLLKFQVVQGREHLPQSFHPTRDRCSNPSRGLYCFRAGDERVNEQPGLTMIHLIWLRQHNLIARALAKINPYWNDERLFQETRRIITAQWQVVIYKEWLPLVLGSNLMNKYKLYVQNSGYTQYDPYVDATMLNEFAAAAFRFGHTLIQTSFNLVNGDGSPAGSIRLEDNYFFPFDYYDAQKDFLDRMLRGMLTQPLQRFDRFVTTGVSNHLYRLRNETFGLDLIALNTQRGRDHGIRPYIDYVRLCHRRTITRFEDLSFLMRPEQIETLNKVYLRVGDIDLFSGGVSEEPISDGIVGPTFGCIQAEQFVRAKYGDRFYFEHGGQAGSFTTHQLQSLRQTTLAAIICDNSDALARMQPNVFRPPSSSNNFVNCANFPRLNLALWKE